MNACCAHDSMSPRTLSSGAAVASRVLWNYCEFLSSPPAPSMSMKIIGTAVGSLTYDIHVQFKLVYGAGCTIPENARTKAKPFRSIIQSYIRRSYLGLL